MLKAYFDESAHGTMVSVCGFVAREDQWQQVEADCRSVFDLFDMPYLHMQEFARPDAPAYSDLPYAERFRAMEAIMFYVRRNVPIAVTVSLDARSFESATFDAIPGTDRNRLYGLRCNGCNAGRPIVEGR
jgi:hypothetical protein